MNVDRRWLGTSVVRVRVLAAAVVVLAAGCMVLGWGSRSRHMAANISAGPSSLLASIPGLPQSAASATPAPSDLSRARSLLAGLPMIFEPNQGQANLDPSDRRAQFIARGSGYSLMLGSEGAILNLRAPNQNQKSTHRSIRINSLRMALANANPNPSLSGGDLLPGKSNYILGNDPSKWQHNVPQFARVRYENVYPGINLAFYGNQGKLEYDFQVAPGSDPSQAELEFDGAKHLKLQDGNLVIEAPDGVVRLDAPRVYQRVNGHEQPVEGSFVLRADNHVGFAIGSYDHSRELVIDPVLNYSSYFGGNGDEHATQLALDNVGNIYIAGSTTSTNLPAAGVFQTTLNGTQNIYIAKIQVLNPLSLQFVTYLGGNGTDSPVGVAVDAGGNPFVAGTTSSTNFPTTTNAYQQFVQTGSTGTNHVFVTGLNPTATSPLRYSTYLSGSGDDVASGMTIDVRENVYVTGTTTSVETLTTDQFPASNLPQGIPFQNASRLPGQEQFFVTKVNTQASGNGSIAYSTYFGGANSVTAPVAIGGGITVDANGNIYFTGTTNFTYTGCQGCNTTDFPILNAYQPCLDQPSTAGTGNPPTCTNPANGDTDAFVAKLNPSAQGSQLQWSTYFGGTANDSGTAVALDPVGAANVYLVGTTNSTDVTTLTTFAAYQRCLDTPPVNPPSTAPCSTTVTAKDAYVARLTNPATSTVATNVSLSYFSYLGGSGDDAGLALTVDPANGAVVTGWTKSGDFPITPNSIQGSLSGPQDAFVARLNTVAVTGQNSVASWAVFFGGTGTDQGTGVALDANENVYVAGDTNSTDLQVDKPLVANTSNSGGFDAFVAQLATASSLSLTGQLQSGPTQTYIAAGSQATFVYTVTNEGPDLATNITVTDDLTTTGIPVTFNSASATSGTCSGGSTSTNVSCNIQSLQAGSTATVTIILTPTPNPTGGAATFNGGKVTATSPNNITPNQASVSAKMSDFGIQVLPSSVSVPIAGAPASYQVTLTPYPVYASTISLSCSLPTGLSGAACVFSPSSVTLNGTSPSAPTLTITTTARPVPLPAVSLFSLRFLGLWLPVPGLALIGIGMGRDRRRRRMFGLFLLCLISALILLQPACSGGSSSQPPPAGTPAGSYTITVTATSGSDSKSAAVGLVVP